MPPNQHYHVHHVFPAHACLSFCIRHILFDSPRREGHPLILIFKCQVATYFDVCRIYWELLKCVSQQGEQYIISLITNKKDCVVMHNFQNFFVLEDSLEICRGKRWTKDGWHKDQSRDWRLSQVWPTIRGCPICHVIYFSPNFVPSLQNTAADLFRWAPECVPSSPLLNLPYLVGNRLSD